MASTVPATVKTELLNIWLFRRCSRLMPDEHFLALTSPTWRLISQWNSVVWRRSCRRQTCPSRKQRPCQFGFRYSAYKFLNIHQVWPISQRRKTWLRVGSIRDFLTCLDLPRRNDGFRIHFHRFTSRTKHNTFPHMGAPRGNKPSRVKQSTK